MATVLEVLERARELYAEAPSHAAMLDVPKYGTHCVLTAIFDGHPRRDNLPAQFAELEMYRAAGVKGTLNLVTWNADHSTEEVLAAFDRAIENERERCRIPDGRALALA